MLTTTTYNWKRAFVTVAVAFGIMASLSAGIADVAEAKAMDPDVTYTKVTMVCFSGKVRANTQLTHKYLDTRSENWLTDYRLVIYKWSSSTRVYDHYATTDWLAGYGGLNYELGKSFTQDLNLPAGNFTVGAQVAVLNPHTGEWLWDRTPIFGYAQSTPQESCNVQY